MDSAPTLGSCKKTLEFILISVLSLFKTRQQVELEIILLRHKIEILKKKQRN